MNTLEKEFIPYQESLELKELGFDEPFKIFDQAIVFRNKGICMANEYALEYFDFYGDEVISAPLKQQVFRWFREKYDLHSTITSISQESWQWHITKPGESLGKLYEEDFYTYEEAELECLKKLIEIVKNK